MRATGPRASLKPMRRHATGGREPAATGTDAGNARPSRRRFRTRPRLRPGSRAAGPPQHTGPEPAGGRRWPRPWWPRPRRTGQRRTGQRRTGPWRTRSRRAWLLSLLDQGPDPVARQKLLTVRGRSVAWLPPAVLLVAVLALDWHTGGDFRVISWIVLVPGIASAVCRVVPTAVFAVLAVLAYLVFDGAWPHEYQNGTPDFILVVVGGALSLLACAVRVRGEQRMLHMRDVAETTRRTVLRPLPPGWGDLEHAAVYLTADSEARVGGDFYDIQPGLHGTRVLLGDVQGKGLGAVETAAALLGTFREAAYHVRRLDMVAARLEVRMQREVRYRAQVGGAEGERFATAVLVGFPASGSGADTGTVEVVNFGHEPPLVLGPHGVRTLPAGAGLPLGLGDLADSPPVVQRVPLAPDETLLLFTDGVTEARDGDGRFFPLRERLEAAFADDPRIVSHPGPLVGLVRDGTREHSGGRLSDDTTVFAVRRCGEGELRGARGARGTG